VSHIQRRTFLKSTVAAAVLGVVGGSLLKPIKALAAEWPKAAFDSKKMEDALQSLYGTTQTTASAAIKVKAPPVAENGATVPVSVTADMPNVESIAIFVEKNPQPLAASISLNGADGFFSTQIKMGQTSPVHFVVKAGGKLYSTKAEIKVTAGGCGG
jgi:sulfur-oxidizing protein SoxY